MAKLSTSHRNKKVFLGGTVNGSLWRDELIPKLQIDYFNPVTDNWNEEAQKREIYERENCDYNLYIISPKMVGHYSLAEVLDDSFKKPGKTFYCFLNEDEDKKFTTKEINSLRSLGRRVESNGGIWCKSIVEVTTFFNKVHRDIEYYQTYQSILQNAVKWNRSGRGVNQLLKGFSLVDASRWLEESRTSDVIPATQLIKDYYDASIEEERGGNRISVFISYARNPTLSFAQALFDTFSEQGIDVWFDKHNIRAGIDFRNEIKEGIERAGNFIYIISNRATQSIYCQQELDLAKEYGKRILSVNYDVEGKHISRLDPDITNKDWFDYNHKFSEKQNAQEACKRFIETLNEGKAFIYDHTKFLKKALEWSNAGKQRTFFIKRNDLIEGFKWLSDAPKFRLLANAGILQSEFICESKKKAKNEFVDFWICNNKRDAFTNKVMAKLHANAITTGWSEVEDSDQLELRIIKSEKFLFIINASSINDKKCLLELDFARKHQVPIVPLITEDIGVQGLLSPEENEASKRCIVGEDIRDDLKDFFQRLKNNDKYEQEAYQEHINFLEYKFFNWASRIIPYPDLISGELRKYYDSWLQSIGVNDFLTHGEKTTLYQFFSNIEHTYIVDNQLNKLLDIEIKEVKKEENKGAENKGEYYEDLQFLRYKQYKWSTKTNPYPFLLRGPLFDHYQAWLKTFGNRNPALTDKFGPYIEACKEDGIDLVGEVFISYHEESEDFAFRLNEQLNEFEKVTWNDQKNISSSGDSWQETLDAIEVSENFVVIISEHYFDHEKTNTQLRKALISNKKIVFLKDDPELEVPNEYKDFSVVDFRDGFELGATKLLKELDTDYQYVKDHNKIFKAALEWDKSGKVFSDTELEWAKSWKEEAKSKFPKPTDLQIKFIEASEAAEIKRERIKKTIFYAIVAMAIISICLAVFAFHEQGKAIENAKIAKENARVAKEKEDEANENARIAEENEKRANDLAKKAERSAREAKEKGEEALRSQNIALENEEKAKISAKEALDNAALAKTNLGIAKKNAKTAIENALEAEKQKSKADSLKKIENGKNLTLIADKLLLANNPHAVDTALAAYDSLNKLLSENKVSNILFSTMANVRDRLFTDKVHLLKNAKALVHFEKRNERIYAISENGKIWIKNIELDVLWSAEHDDLRGVQVFDIYSDTLAVGNRYGLFSLFRIYNNGKQSYDIELIAQNQNHERNANILLIKRMNLAGKSVWLSIGHDGQLISCYYSGSAEMTSVSLNENQLPIVTDVVATDIDMTGNQLVIATKRGRLIHYSFNDNAEIGWHEIDMEEALINEREVSSMKFVAGSEIVIVGLQNGALKAMNLTQEKLYDLEKDKEHTIAITDIEITGSLIVTSSRDAAVKLRHWDRNEFKEPYAYVLTYNGHAIGNEVKQVVFDRNADRVFSMDNNGIHMWPTNIKELYRELKESLLTRENE